MGFHERCKGCSENSASLSLLMPNCFSLELQIGRRPPTTGPSSPLYLPLLRHRLDDPISAGGSPSETMSPCSLLRDSTRLDSLSRYIQNERPRDDGRRTAKSLVIQNFAAMPSACEVVVRQPQPAADSIKAERRRRTFPFPTGLFGHHITL